MDKSNPKKTPSAAQRAMLEAAMKVAYESGESFGSSEEIKLYLEREGAPAVCLLDENASELLDCIMKYFFRPGCPPKADRQATIVLNGAITPPQSNKSDEGKTATSQERAAVGESQDGEEFPTFEADEPRFFLHASHDSTAKFEAFIARMCKQRTSFLSAQAARRLGLKSVPGLKHTLCWHSDADGMNEKTRRTSFTVVDDALIPTNVAVGTEWSTEEPGTDIDDAESSHSAQEQAQPLDNGCRVQPWLSQQAQQSLMSPQVSDYPMPPVTIFEEMCLDHIRQLHKDSLNHSQSVMTNLRTHLGLQMAHPVFAQSLQPRRTPQRQPGRGDPP